MSKDTIYRQDAIDALAEHEKSRGHNYTLFVNIVSECAEIIRNLPSAQPEIVRCRECKHCRKVDESEYWCYGFCSPARLVRKDDFCSYGERRDNE